MVKNIIIHKDRRRSHIAWTNVIKRLPPCNTKERGSYRNGVLATKSHYGNTCRSQCSGTGNYRIFVQLHKFYSNYIM